MRVAQYLVKSCVRSHGSGADIPSGDIASLTECIALNLPRLVGKADATERLGKDEVGEDSCVGQTPPVKLWKHARNCLSVSAVFHGVGELAHAEKRLRHRELGAHKVVRFPAPRSQSEQLVAVRFGLREFSPDHVAKAQT